ncbi:MAG: hypothetical protein GX193_10615 [Clostridiales bacterium]|nr:hypothetical protein [Clostridiales bacterium]
MQRSTVHELALKPCNGLIIHELIVRLKNSLRSFLGRGIGAVFDIMAMDPALFPCIAKVYYSNSATYGL